MSPKLRPANITLLAVLGVVVVVCSTSVDLPFVSDYDYGLPHHRSARSVSHDNIPTADVQVDNVTFYFHKMGIYENVTCLSPGSKIHFRLAVHFPVGTTDMVIELFTPDNETTLMTVCDVHVTWTGTALTMSGSDVPEMDAKVNGSTLYDRAILSLGNVTNSGGGSVAYDSMLYVEWDVIMVDINDTNLNGSVEWASAGAEYDQESMIFVAQASICLIIDDWKPSSGSNGEYNLTCPEWMEIGSAARFSLRMCIPYSYTTLSVDAFAPMNASEAGVFSICSMVLAGAEDSYKCLDSLKDTFESVEYPPSDGSRGNERAHLDIGTVINSRSRESGITPGVDDCIYVDFVTLLYDNESYIGQSYWIGTAVEIGNDLIFAAQCKVVAIAKDNSSTSTEVPTFKLYATQEGAEENNVALIVGGTMVLNLNVSLPENTSTEYEFQTLMPYNDSAPRMSICRVELVSHGANIPCMGDNQAELKSRNESNTTFDYSVWKLGKIFNAGFKDGNIHTDANTMYFRAIIKMLDHPWNTEGEYLWPTMGFTIDPLPEKLWVGQHSVMFTENVTSIDEQCKAPVCSLEFVDGDDSGRRPGESALVRLECVTEVNANYQPMEFEVILPFNGTTIMSICRAELVFVGYNLACTDREAINASIVLLNKTAGDKYNKAVISLGPVANVGGSDVAKNNTFIIDFVVQVENHPEIGTTFMSGWISTGVHFCTSRIWVGQRKMTYILDGSSPTMTNDAYINVTRTDAVDANIGQGQTAEYDIFIKMPALSASKITLTVTSNHAQLSICSLIVMEYGGNIPCGVVEKGTEANFTVRSDGQSQESAALDFGIVTNVGNSTINMDAVFDNETLRLKCLVKADATIPLNDVATVSFAVHHGGPASTTQLDAALTAVTEPINGTDNGSLPNLEWTPAQLSEEDNTPPGVMYWGQAKRFLLHLKYNTSLTLSSNKIVVKVITPVNTSGVMDVCGFNVIYVGRNMMCMNRMKYLGTSEFSQRANSEYNDIGGISLGAVCYRPIYDEEEDNQIVVEAIVRLGRNLSIADGDSVPLSATVAFNDDLIYVTQYNVTVREVFNESFSNGNANNMSMDVVSSPAQSSWRPGSRNLVEFSVTVPANTTSLALIDVSLPYNTSAILTVYLLRVVSAGVNLACLARAAEGSELVFSSPLNNTQNTRAYIDLGVLTNTGESYRSGNYSGPEDDTAVLEVGVQVADNILSEDSAEFVLSLGSKVDGVIVILDQAVTISRNGSEAPDLCLQAQANTSITYHAKSENISIWIILQHCNLSSAEGQNVSVTFSFPSYISFVSFTDNHTYSVTHTVGQNGVTLTMETLLFTDIVEVVLELAVRPGASVGGGEGLAALPYEAYCNMWYRTANVNPEGTVFSTDTYDLTFNITTDTTCTGVLGMQNNLIQDCQISGTTSPYANKQAVDGRMGSATYFKSSARGHKTKTIAVNFGNVTKVCSVQIEFMTDSGCTRPDDYLVQHSDDGYNWRDNVDGAIPISADSVDDAITCTDEARFVRLKFSHSSAPSGWAFCLTVEFNGCQTVLDTSLTDTCSAGPGNWVHTQSTLSTRSYFVDIRTGYSQFIGFCDNSVQSMGVSNCYISSDGQSWTSGPPSATQVLGSSIFREYNGQGDVIGQEREIFFQGADAGIVLRTADEGATYTSVNSNWLTDARADVNRDFQEAKDIPDFPQSEFASYTFGTWAATSNGIENSGTKVVDWN